MYLDVPYDPTGYRVQGTKCRVYDDAAVLSRLTRHFHPQWVGYVEHKAPGTLIPKPSQAVQPFHYVALVLQKPTPRIAN